MTRNAILSGLMASVAFIVPAAAQQTTTEIGQINVEGAPQEAPGAGYIIPEDSPKERSTVTQAAIEQAPSGANVYQLISRLPGVNAIAADGAGLFGGAMSMRGFDSSEIGFTIAGVPVNDSGNYAIYPSEYVDQENLREIDVTQGAPDVDQPQGGAVGGSVQMLMQDPTDQFRIKLVQSLGQLDYFKSFGRVDTGNIFDTGMKAFISYSKAEENKFKGEGNANHDHIDAGWVLETDQGSKFTATSIFNSQITYFLSSVNLAQYHQYGRSLDYENNLVAPPTPAAGTAQSFSSCAGCVSSYPLSSSYTGYSRANWWGYHPNPFNNEIASFNADIKVLDNLHVSLTPYYWNGYGNGGGASTISEASSTTAYNGYGSSGLYFGPSGIIPKINGNPPYPSVDLNGDGDKLDTVGFYRPSITSTQRPGINTEIAYQPIDWDTIKFGVDFDHSRHHQTQPYEFLNPDGAVPNIWADTPSQLLTRPDGSIVQGRDELTFNNTTVAFFENTLSLLDDTLKVLTGIKRQEVTRDGNNNLPGAIATGLQSVIHPTADYLSFLPELQVSYRITPENMVFVNLQKNARAPSNYTLYESNYDTIGDQIQETSWDLDVGYRYQTQVVYASMSLFAINFSNRQMDIALPDDPTETTDINAGTVHNRGVEAELGTAKPINDFNLYGSASYTKSIIESNLPTGSGYVRTAGETYVNTPKWLVAGVVEYVPSYLPGAYFSVSPKYTSGRESTLVNDEKIKGFTSVDLGAGYKFDDGMFGSDIYDVKLQANVTNLLDRDYLYFGLAASSTQVAAHTVTTLSGKTYSGATPTYSEGAPRFFSVKLSASFGPHGEAAAATPAVYTPPPAQAPMPASTARSYMVFFDFNKSDLTPQAVTIVDQAAKNAGPSKVTQLTVTGHTDTVGSDAYNMRLSRRRAESVAAELEKQGIPSSEIEIVAKGKHDLLVPTGDGVREPQNRRVQIVYGGPAS
jgi:iron complex outermembrane receptor protein